MFSVRLVKADHYMNAPLPGLDVRYSEFRGSEVKQVPVIRIFGSTTSGQKVCLHVHGVFPYIYVPYDGSIEKEKILYQVAAAIDKALNTSLGNSTSHTQHVYKVTLVSAIPFYGYHSKTHQFLKIYFYNPLMVKKASDLLQNGVVLGKVYQPHESHIPFILQFCMDYNLHGMSLVHLSSVRYRRGTTQDAYFTPAPLDNVPEELILPVHVSRMSTCSLEVDAVAADIVNRQEIAGEVTSNPGLKAIWDEERERRRNENRSSQFTPQSSQARPSLSTASETLHLDRLKMRLCEVALLNENPNTVMKRSPCDEKLMPYPAQTPDGEDLVDASFLLTHVGSLDEKMLGDSGGEKMDSDTQVADMSSIPISPSDLECASSQSSVLNSQCLSLVQMLQEMVEDDSVLGSQCQGVEENEQLSDDEEHALSQTLQIDEIRDRSPVTLDRTENPSCISRVCGDKEDLERHDSRKNRFLLPQLDGANDLLREEVDDEANGPLHLGLQSEHPPQQLLQVAVDGTSEECALPGSASDVREVTSLSQEQSVVNELEYENGSEPCNDVNCDKSDVESDATMPLDLGDGSESFLGDDTSENLLLNLGESCKQKCLLFPDSANADCTDDTEKDVLSNCILMGDPWLTAKPIVSDKEEFFNGFSPSPTSDCDNATWVSVNEKYFSETSHINLPEVDELPCQYESDIITEFPGEQGAKSTVQNSVSSSETKRRLCCLIRSRTKAKEAQTAIKTSSEFITVDEIVNSEMECVVGYENSAHFSSVLQGTDYDQLLDESCHSNVQNLLGIVGEEGLLSDCELVSNMKMSSGSNVEVNKNKEYHFPDETCGRLQELGATVPEYCDNILMPKNLPQFACSKRRAKEKSPMMCPMDAQSVGRPEDQLPCEVYSQPSQMKKRGRKPRGLKDQEQKIVKTEQISDNSEKLGNSYHLRNRVQNFDQKKRRKSKEVNVQSKDDRCESECANKDSETADSDMKTTLNFDNRTVKERLGILVRNSMGKKHTARGNLVEDCKAHRTVPSATRIQVSHYSSRRTRSMLQPKNSVFPEECDAELPARQQKQRVLCSKSTCQVPILERGDELQTTAFEGEVTYHKSSTYVEQAHSRICISSNHNNNNNNNNNCSMTSLSEKEKTALAKKRIGQYVRQRLGMLVESRSKLLSGSNKSEPLPTKGCSSPLKNVDKFCTRSDRKKQNVDLPVGVDVVLTPEDCAPVDENVSDVCSKNDSESNVLSKRMKSFNIPEKNSTRKSRRHQRKQRVSRKVRDSPSRRASSGGDKHVGNANDQSIPDMSNILCAPVKLSNSLWADNEHVGKMLTRYSRNKEKLFTLHNVGSSVSAKHDIDNANDKMFSEIDQEMNVSPSKSPNFSSITDNNTDVVSTYIPRIGRSFVELANEEATSIVSMNTMSNISGQMSQKEGRRRNASASAISWKSNVLDVKVGYMLRKGGILRQMAVEQSCTSVDNANDKVPAGEGSKPGALTTETRNSPHTMNESLNKICTRASKKVTRKVPRKLKLNLSPAVSAPECADALKPPNEEIVQDMFKSELPSISNTDDGTMNATLTRHSRTKRRILKQVRIKHSDYLSSINSLCLETANSTVSYKTDNRSDKSNVLSPYCTSDQNIVKVSRKPSRRTRGNGNKAHVEHAICVLPDSNTDNQVCRVEEENSEVSLKGCSSFTSTGRMTRYVRKKQNVSKSFHAGSSASGLSADNGFVKEDCDGQLSKGESQSDKLLSEFSISSCVAFEKETMKHSRNERNITKQSYVHDPISGLFTGTNDIDKITENQLSKAKINLKSTPKVSTDLPTNKNVYKFTNPCRNKRKLVKVADMNISFAQTPEVSTSIRNCDHKPFKDRKVDKSTSKVPNSICTAGKKSRKTQPTQRRKGKLLRQSDVDDAASEMTPDAECICSNEETSLVKDNESGTLALETCKSFSEFNRALRSSTLCKDKQNCLKAADNISFRFERTCDSDSTENSINKRSVRETVNFSDNDSSIAFENSEFVEATCSTEYDDEKTIQPVQNNPETEKTMPHSDVAPNAQCPEPVDKLLNLYSIRPCYILLKNCESDDLKDRKFVASCDKNSNSDKTNLENCTSAINDDQHEDELITSCDNVSTFQEQLKSSSLSYTKEKKHLKANLNNSENMPLTSLSTSCVNSTYNHNNSFECAEMNMKCVVPNSSKSVNKTMKKTGDLGSLKAVVQAESPRVADTLDTLPENPAQTIRHYAPGGGVYLDSAQSECTSTNENYLRQSNSVEVAKIPSQIFRHCPINLKQDVSNGECNEQKEKNCDAPISVDGSKRAGHVDKSCEDFLSFTRKMPLLQKKRTLSNSKKIMSKTKKASVHENPSARSALALNTRTFSVDKNQVKIEVNDKCVEEMESTDHVMTNNTTLSCIDSAKKAMTHEEHISAQEFEREDFSRGSQPDSQPVKVQNSTDIQSDMSWGCLSFKGTNAFSTEELLHSVTQPTSNIHQLPLSEPKCQNAIVQNPSVNVFPRKEPIFSEMARERKPSKTIMKLKKKESAISKHNVSFKNNRINEFTDIFSAKRAVLSSSEIKMDDKIAGDSNCIQSMQNEIPPSQHQIDCKKTLIFGNNFMKEGNKRKCDEMRHTRETIPCVDGAANLSDSDSSEDFTPLSVLAMKRTKLNKKTCSTPEMIHKYSQPCDGDIAKLGGMNSSRILKAPFENIVKKLPFKIPGKCLTASAGMTHSSVRNEDLTEALTAVFGRPPAEREVHRFQPLVLLERVNFASYKKDFDDSHSTRTVRRRTLKNEICICADYARKKAVANVLCEKLKGVSLDLQKTKHPEVTCWGRRGDLAKEACQLQSESEEQLRQENIPNITKESLTINETACKMFTVSKEGIVSNICKVDVCSSDLQISAIEKPQVCPGTTYSELIGDTAAIPCSVNDSSGCSFSEKIPKKKTGKKKNLNECKDPQNNIIKKDSTGCSLSSLCTYNSESNISLFDKPTFQMKSESTDRKDFNTSVIYTPKEVPPTRKQVLQSLSCLNIPQQKFLEPYFSNPSDVVEGKEVGHKYLKIKNRSVRDLDLFQSIIPDINGINSCRNQVLRNLWEQSQSSSSDIVNSFESEHLKAALAGQRETIITLCTSAPAVADVKLWSEKQLANKERKRAKKRAPSLKQHGLASNESQTLCNPSRTRETGLQDCVSQTTYLLTNENPTQELAGSCVVSLVQRKEVGMSCDLKLDCTQEEGNSRPDESENGTDATEENSQNSTQNTSRNGQCLHKVSGQTSASLDSWSSQSQIQSPVADYHVGSDCISHDSLGFKMSYENLQDCRAVMEPQYLTLLALEIHVQTRANLNPDPAHDPVCAAFYCVQNDVPEDSALPRLLTGMIIVQGSTAGRKNTPLVHNIEVNCITTYVAEERTLMDEVIRLVRLWDPDILAGYEVEMHSWGYLFERAYVLELNLCPLVSRIPGTRQGNKSRNTQDESVVELQEEFSLLGRIVLNVWRLMRHEVALQSYTFENVSFHVLHERIPLVSFKTLSQWWGHRTKNYQGRVADHYLLRVRGLIRILDQLDLINRTSELARIFGIQFYEVLSRGSQFRVESMMLRLAKPMNYVPLSPSVEQRAHMRAPEHLQLILEPESQLYTDPVIVLDFQSLYPSMIIAYNYCYSTCLGRVEHLGQTSPFEFGSYHLCVPPDELNGLLSSINVSPCGVAFVNESIRKGLLPRMLEEILETRFMVKKAMKEHMSNKTLQRVLHARQLGLKLIANVTYGYTSANFSGRMSCVEIADSVVSKGRETLERAVRLVERSPRWAARVVYGDTDSLFVLVPGRSREAAFAIGAQIADAVTRTNPQPVKLKLEKVYQPCLLQTKKRYVGYMYESASQKEPVYDAKGIETVRRDGCPAVAKVLERSLRLLFETKDLSKVKAYVKRKFSQILEGQMSLQNLIFAREYRGRAGYRPGACVPALELAKRRLALDARAEPRVGERVPFVVASGAPQLPLIRLVRAPHELLQEPALRPHAHYYVARALCPPLARCLGLLGADVHAWYTDLPRRKNFSLPKYAPVEEHKKITISQYFSKSNCVICHQICQVGICSDCQKRPQNASIELAENLHSLERTYHSLEKMCASCCRYPDQVRCISLDCPVMYRRTQAQHAMLQAPFLRHLQESICPQ